MDEMMKMIQDEIGATKIEENRARIVELICSTEREGMDNLIRHMQENGFFAAPCSTQYHLAKEGGLAEHSLNVYDAMVRFYNAQSEFTTPPDSIIIVALLHDLGKMGHHGKQNYVPNILKGGKRSDAKPYATNDKLLYVPHEIESVAIASRFIELTEAEEHAIIMHNALYGDLKYAYNGKETELSMLLHFADLWSARIIEKEEE